MFFLQRIEIVARTEEMEILKGLGTGVQVAHSLGGMDINTGLVWSGCTYSSH